MADMNSMTRIVGKLRVPCIVIDKETGERLHRHAIDAREMIATGRYEWADDVTGVAVPEVKVDSHGNPIALVNVVVPAEPEAIATPEPEPEPEPVIEDAVVEDAEDEDEAEDESPAPKAKAVKKAVKGARKK